MKHLYFIRHGLSELGKQKLWAGSTDTPLAPEGRDQAKVAGGNAKELHIDYILCSPLSRAHETATIIAKEIGYPEQNIEVNSLVIERDFGPLEATSWDPTFDVNQIAEAESAASVLNRARQTYEYVQTLPYDNILIVSHGSFGRALRHIIHPEIPFDNTGRLENAQVLQLL